MASPCGDNNLKLRAYRPLARVGGGARWRWLLSAGGWPRIHNCFTVPSSSMIASRSRITRRSGTVVHWACARPACGRLDRERLAVVNLSLAVNYALGGTSSGAITRLTCRAQDPGSGLSGFTACLGNNGLRTGGSSGRRGYGTLTVTTTGRNDRRNTPQTRIRPADFVSHRRAFGVQCPGSSVPNRLLRDGARRPMWGRRPPFP